MNNENMDRLFREGADQYEIKPSASAWDAIQGQVESKNSAWGMAWKVAAVLVVTISSVFLTLTWKSSEVESIAGTPDHPQLVSESLVWNLPEVTEQIDVVRTQVAMPSQQEEVLNSKPEISVMLPEKDVRLFLELESLPVAWEIQMPEKPALFMESEPKTSVTIRYFASTTEATGEDKKKSIGQFIARAQAKLSPDELLADIRTAKDDFFKGNRGD